MSHLSLQQAFALAVEHHQAGRLPEAEQLYRRILAAAPNQPDALHYLGVIAHQIGQHAAAIELMSRAINAGGARNASIFNNLGEAFRAAGQIEKAAECYREAIRLEPNFPGAHSNLGITLHNAGRLDE